MSVNHGFHATMTARPGKGDELVELPARRAVPANEDCVVFLVGRSAGTGTSSTSPRAGPARRPTAGSSRPRRHRRWSRSSRPLLAGESEYVDEVPVGGKAAF